MSQEVLEKGTTGVINFFLDELYSKWLKSAELVVVTYGRAELVPFIKGLGQSGRTEKIGKCDRAFDPLCAIPLPPSQVQAWLRAPGRAARDGIAAYLCFCGLSDDLWPENAELKATIAFCGVQGTPQPYKMPVDTSSNPYQGRGWRGRRYREKSCISDMGQA